MILDTPALLAILFGEAEAEQFARLIVEADVCRMSVANRLEPSIVLARQAKPDAARQAEAFLRAAGVVEEPVTIEQGTLARQAFYDFGKGRRRAGLNFGDCFAYALSKVTNEALLFKGHDFLRTDVRAAHRPE